MLAPPGFWAPDFDHMSLTGLIGLPAPGYALSDVKPPPPLPEPVLSSQPVPAASDTSYLEPWQCWHLEIKKLPNQVSGASWEALGRLLEALGWLLEALGRVLEASGRPPRGILGQRP